eukprot:gene7742-9522_t
MKTVVLIFMHRNKLGIDDKTVLNKLELNDDYIKSILNNKPKDKSNDKDHVDLDYNKHDERERSFSNLSNSSNIKRNSCPSISYLQNVINHTVAQNKYIKEAEDRENRNRTTGVNQSSSHYDDNRRRNKSPERGRNYDDHSSRDRKDYRGERNYYHRQHRDERDNRKEKDDEIVKRLEAERMEYNLQRERNHKLKQQQQGLFDSSTTSNNNEFVNKNNNDREFKKIDNYEPDQEFDDTIPDILKKYKVRGRGRVGSRVHDEKKDKELLQKLKHNYGINLDVYKNTDVNEDEDDTIVKRSDGGRDRSRDREKDKKRSRSKSRSRSRSTSTSSISSDDRSYHSGMDELVAAADSLRCDSNLLLNPADLKLRFDDISSTINVDDDTMKLAWNFIENLQLQSDTSEQIQKNYIACSLFISGNKKFSSLIKKGDSKEKETTQPQPQQNNTVLLSQLLKASNIKLLDFFKHMNTFIELLHLDEKFENQLKTLKHNFIVLSVLYWKYVDIFLKIFQTSSNNNNNNNNNSVISSENEEYLLSIGLNLIYIQSNPEFHRLPINEIATIYDNNNNAESSSEINNNNNNNSNISKKSIIPYLCTVTGGNTEEVLNVDLKVFPVIIDMLINNQILKSKNDITSSNQLKNNYSNLNRAYEQFYYSNGDIDERLFLFDQDIIGGAYKTPNKKNSSGSTIMNQLNPRNQPPPPSPSSSSSNQYRKYSHHHHHLLEQFAHTPTTPTKLHQVQTPISEIFSMVSWVKKIGNYQQPTSSSSTTTNSIEPPEELIKLLKENSYEPELEKIISRVNELSSKVTNLYLTEEIAVSSNDENHCTKRKNLAIKLYYYLLYKILLSEGGLTKSSNTTNNNNNSGGGNNNNIIYHNDFHKSLLAISFEIISFVYRLEHLFFPYFINLFGVHAFSFIRLIDIVIRTEDSIPQQLIHHFKSTVEEKILNQLAWSNHSPVFTAFKNEINIKQFSPYYLQNQSMVYVQTHKIFSTPTKPSPSTVTTPTPTSSTSTTTTTTTTPSTPSTPKKPNPALWNFYKKLTSFIQKRCTRVMTSLNLPKELQSQTIATMTAILESQLTMLENRTVDTLIICSIYAICKVNSHDIKFKNIIEKCTSTTSKEVREIYLNENEKCDIIQFYNCVFLQLMDPIIFQIKEQQTKFDQLSKSGLIVGNTIIPPSPTKSNPYQSSSSSVPQSPQRPLPTSSSTTPIFNSPIRVSSTNNNNNTGSTSKSNFYSFSIGKSPAKDLQQINFNINNAMMNPSISTPDRIREQHQPSNLNGTPSNNINNSTSINDVNNNNNNNNEELTNGKSKGKRLNFDDDPAIPKPPLKK